jgi:hypothetical protein
MSGNSVAMRLPKGLASIQAWIDRGMAWRRLVFHAKAAQAQFNIDKVWGSAKPSIDQA